jgi:hypothetical protein
MEFIATTFVGKPLNIFIVALIFVAGWLVLRFCAKGVLRSNRSLLVAATLWGLYAIWEWLISIYTSEADIRVDLLLIWPVITAASAWALIRTFR